VTNKAGLIKVHNGRDINNGKTQHVLVEKKKSRKPVNGKPAPKRVVQTIRPQFIGIEIDGGPGSTRLAVAFYTGLSDIQKAHIKKELLERCKEELMRIRWRTGQGKEKGMQILCMNVRLKGRRRTDPCCPVAETKMDAETYLREIIANMT